MEETKKIPVQFLALGTEEVANICSPVEKEDGRKGYVSWGDNNQYPAFLHALYRESVTLHAVVNGTVDYIVGNGVRLNVPIEGLPEGKVNKRGHSIEAQVRQIARSLCITGGFGLDALRNNGGGIGELYAMDCRELRSDKWGEEFWYSEEWDKWQGGRVKTVKIPRFIGEPSQVEGLIFYKNTDLGTYPEPVYAAAVKAAKTEASISDFHLNAISNGFTGSYIVNFCNGIPSEDEAREIEKRFTRKYTGNANAGRVVFNYANGKDTAATLAKMDANDFADRYEALSRDCRQQIFTAFRCNPNLFGIPTENNGFNAEEYDSAFKLFNRTTIVPMQRVICEAYDRAFGVTGAITIEPFSLEEKEQENTNTANTL